MINMSFSHDWEIRFHKFGDFKKQNKNKTKNKNKKKTKNKKKNKKQTNKKNRTEQNRTEQNRTEQNRTEQNRTEQNKTNNKLQIWHWISLQIFTMHCGFQWTPRLTWTPDMDNSSHLCVDSNIFIGGSTCTQHICPCHSYLFGNIVNVVQLKVKTK